jgi:hypothetical protein
LIKLFSAIFVNSLTWNKIIFWTNGVKSACLLMMQMACEIENE